MPDLDDLRSRAAAVAAVAHLRDVRVFRVDSMLDEPPDGDAGLSYSFNADLEVQAVAETSALIVDGTYRVALTQADPDTEAASETDDERRIATISFQLAALYDVSDRDGRVSEFPDDELDAFAQTTGLLALHPYAREFIANLTARMGLPTLHIETPHLWLDKRNEG